jgi:hypothetical protein
MKQGQMVSIEIVKEEQKLAKLIHECLLQMMRGEKPGINWEAN